jgi:hypothetical protein
VEWEDDAVIDLQARGVEPDLDTLTNVKESNATKVCWNQKMDDETAHVPQFAHAVQYYLDTHGPGLAKRIRSEFDYVRHEQQIKIDRLKNAIEALNRKVEIQAAQVEAVRCFGYDGACCNWAVSQSTLARQTIGVDVGVQTTKGSQVSSFKV